jgi:hypothetical protein
VWDKQRVTVGDVYEELRLQWRIAYTTVMSVLRNPAAKGLPEQDKSKQATSTPFALPGDKGRLPTSVPTSASASARYRAAQRRLARLAASASFIVRCRGCLHR